MVEARHILIDATLCLDCQDCTKACALIHDNRVDPELARLRVTRDTARNTMQINLCRQCDYPDCIPACPNQAIRYDDHGRVILFEEECLQCGSCAEACRYHAIFYNEMLGKYLKCDLCSKRTGGPICVEQCSVGALTVFLEEQ